MTYTTAILICDNIDKETVRGTKNTIVLDDDTRLRAIEKILSMATINAVKKDTLLKVIRWFFDNCVEVETPKEEANNDQT